MVDLKRALKGTIENLKTEIEGGFVGSLQKRVASDVLSDLVQLARVVLDELGDNAKNVAAVLAAAAFEDTIRRMGSVFAGVIGKDDLSDVIEALKMKGFLVPPQLGIVLSFLDFRDRALHANWNDIDRAAVDPGRVRNENEWLNRVSTELGEATVFVVKPVLSLEHAMAFDVSAWH
jgi:hypothetical protein